MTIVGIVRDFFGTPVGAAVVALFALAALDFLLGTFAAIRDGVFQLEAIGAWLRSQVAGKVLPAFVVLLIGHMTGGLIIDDVSQAPVGAILTTIGLGMAGSYVLAVIGSIQESLQRKPSTRAVPED